MFDLREDKAKITQATKDWLSINGLDAPHAEPSTASSGRTFKKNLKNKRRREHVEIVDQVYRLKKALRKAKKAERTDAVKEIELKLGELRKLEPQKIAA